MRGTVRRDIQGLRALAVLLVIANHLAGWPTGGFIGVDVFFVVSGYVITRLLLNESDSTGTISIASFYRRRIKRIMPAAVLVLVATAITASLVYSPTRQSATDTDIAWAAASVANWRFVALGTDYLHAADALSPLQHFWSLSVEEQFYFVWPIAVALVALATRRRPELRRPMLAGLAAAIVCASFAWALHESVAVPASAYFSTFSRGWELAVGCLVACCARWTRHLPARAQTPLAWAGLTGIAVSVLVLDPSSRFPAPGAALPVLATAAILIAGERSELQDVYPLTNRAATWVGDLSYSLYLWHFPVLIFLDAVLPDRGHRYQVIALALIATSALLSYYFVENPLRRSPWVVWRRGAPRGRVPGPGPGRAAAGAVALLVVGISTGVFAVQSRPIDVVQRVDLAGFTHALGTAAERSESRRIDVALQARTWPQLTPAVENPGVMAQAPEWIHDGCLGDQQRALPDPFTNALRCVYGDIHASRTLAVVGDSHAISYLPGIRLALKSGWRIEVYTLEECPAVWVRVNRVDGAPHPDCARFQQQVAAHLRAEHPDVIMMTSANVALIQLTSRASGEALSAEWTAGTAAAVRSLAAATDRLVLIDDPPPTADLPTCYTTLNGPQHCVTPVGALYLQMVRVQQAAVASVQSSSVSYPTNIEWFCSSDGRCPSFIGSTPVTVDGFHLTAAMARSLAPLLRETILGTARTPGVSPTRALRAAHAG